MAISIEERRAIAAKAREAKAAKRNGTVLEREIALARQGAEMNAALNSQPEASIPDGARLDDGDFGDSAGLTFSGNARYVILYSTEDGRPAKVRKERVVNLLVPDKGTRPRWSEKPVNKDWKYTWDELSGKPAKVNPTARMCMLHPDHPNREWYDSIGLRDRTCDPIDGRHAANIPNEFEVRMHMARKHSQEWGVIQQEEQNRIRKEDNDRQERLLQSIVSRGA